MTYEFHHGLTANIVGLVPVRPESTLHSKSMTVPMESQLHQRDLFLVIILQVTTNHYRASQFRMNIPGRTSNHHTRLLLMPPFSSWEKGDCEKWNDS